jgi:photosystem II stability/assembly factor-like uncharacterized protein
LACYNYFSRHILIAVVPGEDGLPQTKGNMKFRNALIAILAVAIPVMAFAQKEEKGEDEKLRLSLKEHRLDAELVARMVRGLGKVEGRHRKSYIIELKDGVSPESAVKKLMKNSEVENVIILKQPARGEGEEEEQGGILEARKFWFSQRAYPNGKIEVEAYKRAAEHRDKFMLPSKLVSPTVVNGSSTQTIQPQTITNNWEFIGPKNLGGSGGTTPWAGRVNAIAYVPGNNNAFYIATSSGGVWKTTDAGVNWTPLSDDWPFMYTSSIAVHPTSTNTIYAGTGDFDGDWSINGTTFGCGLMKSTDGGANWTALGLAQNFDDFSISDILIDPENPQIVTVSLGRGRNGTFPYPNGAGSVYRSTDGGGTWTQVIATSRAYSDLTMSAISAGTRYYYACSQGGVIYRSSDRGATWGQLASPAVGSDIWIDRIVAHPTAQQTAYFWDAQFSRVWKTVNAGGNWTNVSNNLTTTNYFFQQEWYDSMMAVSTTGGVDHVYVGMTDLSQTVNGGTSWAMAGNVYGPGTPKLHPDEHCMVFEPGSATTGLIGSDGGVYKFTYSGGVFSCVPLNANLGITELYHADIHPTNADIVLGGAQDNSTFYSRNGNLNLWEVVSGGDGGWNAINPSNTLVQYSSYVQGVIYRTTTEWTGGFSQIQGQSNGTAFLAPFTLDPNNPNLLYSGAGFGVNRYNASTATWTNHIGGQNLTNQYVLAVTVAPSNSNKIYTGAEDGQVWMTTNAGTNWTQINGGATALPNRAVTSVAADLTNSDDILAGLSGTGTGHVYRCTNPGAGAGRVWTNVSGSGGTALPDIPVNCIARDPHVAGQWYVGTDAGMFMTTDSGGTWTNMSQPLGFPNVQVNWLKIRASDRKMYAATWGRGVWRIQLNYPSIVKSVSTNPTAATSPNNVTGTVTLWQPAGPGGVTVGLSSSNPAAVVPATVNVPQSATSANFTITTSNTGYTSINATITQTLASDPNHTCVLKVNPNNRASFISQTVPTAMVSGQSYPASLVFLNTGGTTWTTAQTFKLYSANPYNNSNWGMNRIPLTTASVAPGANGTFSATVIAPPTAGTYNFQWQPYQESNAMIFGATSTNVSVVVTKLADAARYISRTGATTVGAGADFYIQNTMRNVGTATWTQAAGYTMMTVNPNNDPKWTNTRAYMPTGSSIAPNAQVTFTSLCTAPITPGVYSMQWQVNKNGTPFGDKSPLLNITVTASADNAQYISQTPISTSMGPNTTFSATTTMNNIGSATWDSTYSLLPHGATTWNNAGIPVTGTVAPTNNGVFTATYTAPATPGTYTFQRRMAHNATKFGQASTPITIVVSADAAQYISRTGPTTVNAGADFYIQNIMKNTGTTSWSTATGYSMMTVTPNNDPKWTNTRAYLASGTIAPGANGTFTALCSAPITPGMYTMQWQMNKSSVPFGEKSPLLNMTVVASANNAQYISQTGIPTTIAANATFNATITMKNIGSATWGAGYTLVPTGSIAWGVASINSPATAPNANAVFNQTFTAPATPGTYTFKMRMSQGATKFGQQSALVTITVT